MFAEPATTKKRGSGSAVATLTDLQQQTLEAMQELVRLERERLAADKARLAVEQEALIIKKVKMIQRGWVQMEQG